MDPRQATRTSAKKLTYEDFLSFPDDGLRHELINGEHYVTPAPVIMHQRLLSRLYLQLGNSLAQEPIAECFFAPCDVVLSFHDVVEPDLLVVLRGQAEIVTEKNVQGAPAIAVEVISPGTRRRDERLKRDLYERAGVREYWIVYPDRGVVRVCRRAENGTFETAVELSAAMAESLTSPLLPGFSAPLADLFR
jgi:Uma2 family endonuclease